MTTANGSPSARLTRLTRSTESTPSSWRTRSGRLAEGELDDAPLVGDAAAVELGFDRAQLAEMLTHRLGRDEPPEPLAGGDESVVTQHVECSTDRHPAGAELSGQLGLARQQRAGWCRAHPLTERVGDLPIADPPHRSAFASPNRGWSDSRTCIRVVYVSTNCKRRFPRRTSMSSVSASTPIELVEGVYATLAERVALGHRAPRPAAHADREDPRQPPRRPGRPGARTRRELRRLPTRPGRHAGRHRPDGPACSS